MKKVYWSSNLVVNALLALALFGVGCKKEALRTTGVQQSEENLSVLRVDTFTVEASSRKIDSTQTDGVSEGTFGYLSDAYFGSSTAKFVTQIKPSEEATNILNIDSVVVDSVVFSMSPKTVYGDINSAFSFSLDTLDVDLDINKNYYSNSFLPVGTSPLSTASYDELKLLDAATGEYQTIDFKIDTIFGLNLLKQVNSSIDNALFWENFKGLVISPNISEFSDNLMILADIYNSRTKLTVYYKQTSSSVETESYSFVISNVCERINLFENDYSSGEINNAFNNQNSGKEALYVQDMSGVRVDISLPYLFNLYTGSAIVVNKAEIIIRVNTTVASNHASHPELWLGVYSDENKNDTSLARTFDDFAAELHYNGLIDNNQFTFNITRHIQSLYKGENKNYGFSLLSLSPWQNTNGTVLWGTNPANSTEKMKFVLTYSLAE